MSRRRREAQGALAHGYEDLSADAIAAIDGKELEELCRELLDVERHDRHSADAELFGPQRDCVTDGGSDISLCVRSAPRQSKEDYEAEVGVSLTEDAPGITVYSCKSGPNLRALLLRDARERSERVVDALLTGGRFTILTNRPLDPDAPSRARSRGRAPAKKPGKAAAQGQPSTLREQIAAALWKRMKQRRPEATDPSPRIRFIDANSLKDFLKRRKPVEIRSSLRDKLGVRQIEGIDPIDVWSEVHRTERLKQEHVLFEQDAGRVAAIREIRETLSSNSEDAYGRIVWLIGPPGVGKTRLAIEALNGDERLRRRALVAIDDQRAITALRDKDLLSLCPSALLVVDDCPLIEVDAVVSRFAATATPRSALLVITPRSQEIVAGSHEDRTARTVKSLRIEPMDAEAQRRLIARECGADADAASVDRIAQLTGGFPWFAVLVAREMKASPDTRLETTAHAANLALASRHEAPPNGWERLVLSRARCLLVAMLTESTDWNGLSDADTAGLCRAVGLHSWHEVVEIANDCVRRGILRMRLGKTFKYVTPAILAREVALKLLRSPPDGPGCGPAIQRHARRFAPELYRRLEQIRIGPAEDHHALGEIADGIVAELARACDLGAFGPDGVPNAALQLAADHRPGPLAALLLRLVQAAPLDDLRARREARRDLVSALGALARRPAAFEAAEAALFRLALAEQERFGNSAAGTWKQIFLIELNPTSRTFDQRLPLLRGRCSTGEQAGRLVALGGLEAALATPSFGYGDAPQDGPVAIPTPAEARRARCEAWRLLIALAGDDDGAVGAEARAMIARQLRNAARARLGGEVAGLVRAALGAFSPAEIVALREEIQAIDAYDRAWIEGSPEAIRAWADLARAAAPRSFGERLRHAVGTWGSRDRGKMEPDEALARECLARTVGIDETLDWLESKEAVQAPVLVRILGRVDEGRAWSERLIDRARRGGCPAAATLAAYLQGWQDAGREVEADDVLRAHRDEPPLAAATAIAVHRLGATDERAGWISADLCAGRLDDEVLELLAAVSWAVRPGDHAMATLLRSLLDRGSRAAYAVVLSLLVGLGTAEEVVGTRWREPLRQALRGLAEGEVSERVEWLWERSALRIATMGDVALVLKLTLRRQRAGGARGSRFGWTILNACAAHDPVATWRALAPVLEQRSSDAYAWAIELRFHHLLDRLPADEILRWVGRDSRRAAFAAELATVHGQVLPPLVRGLIARFGADSAVARTLAGRASSTTRTLVASLAEFTAKQIDLARGWARDRDPEVRRWAEALIEDLRRSHDQHDAYEEHEKRRWGT